MKKGRKKQSASLFGRMASWCFGNARLILIVLLSLLIAGSAVYSSFIKREGFPSIQFPLSFVNATYFVEDADVVDSELAQPFYEAVSDIEGVSEVRTTSNPSNLTGVVFFEEDVAPSDGAVKVEQAIEGIFPEQAQYNVISVDPAAYLNKYDLLLTVYGGDGNIAELEEVAQFVANDIVSLPEVTVAEPQPLLSSAQNPESGEVRQVQTSFNKVGVPEGDSVNFYKAVTVGVDRDADNYDVIELSEAVSAYLNNLSLDNYEKEYQVLIGADFAESINTQINSLQSNLFTGLLAVAAVSLLLITWRASIITAVFMVTVMAATILLLYLFGYTLNTITLFALVLSLGLFVDDATIVVEAIDAAKSRRKKAKTIVKEAVSKIGAASFSGTFTTVLVFLPLAFISGILGEFIRLMPITVIIALVSSLLLSLTVIPALSKYILLRNLNPGWLTRINPISALEKMLAKATGNLPRTLKTIPKFGKVISVAMVSLSIISLLAAALIASEVPFNIFPPSKDSDQVGVSLQFPENYTIEDAKATSAVVDQTISEEIPDITNRVTYGSFNIVQPNARSADILIDLIPFNERETSSQEVIQMLQSSLDKKITDGTKVQLVQYDAGPPTDEFPFKVQVYSEDTKTALALAEEIEAHLSDATITRPNGETAQIVKTQSPNTNTISRIDGKSYVEVAAAFDGSDTSALLTAAESYTTGRFTDEYLKANGFGDVELTYDFGQESENAESFAALGVVFPVALGLMYLLLTIQFRSFLQPLLIFMAIPFTFLGVFAGLYLTDNSISFFVMVGLIGLIGIAVNNTILLTTYANQERAEGADRIDSISTAITKRFRPLLATTVTTVVALLPLALSDPFWEALAFTIIFGLISSTVLVMLAFPYYYLLFERARNSTQAKRFMLWLIGLIVLIGMVGFEPGYAIAALCLYVLATLLLKNQWKRIR